MIDNDIMALQPDSVSNIIHRGGTILKSSRCPAFLTKEGRQLAYDNLRSHGIDALVAIGGDGTYAAMQEFHREFGLPFIGMPGTIDNDLYGTDYTIGFDTAINTAIEAIDRLRDTAESHDRTFFVEVMGRDAGFIALHAGLAGGAEAIFIPEEDGQVDAWMSRMQQRTRKKAFHIIVVSEGETEGNTYDIADRFRKTFPEIDTRVTVIGHLQRGGSPTAFDRNLASLLGAAAVNRLLAGESNLAMGWSKGEISATEVVLAIKGSKRIDRHFLELMQVLGK